MWWKRKKDQPESEQPSAPFQAPQPAPQQSAQQPVTQGAQQPPAGHAPPPGSEVEFLKDADTCLVSKNILTGVAPLKWMDRREANAPGDTGWVFLSEADDSAYEAVAANYESVSLNRMCTIEPAVSGIYQLPVGSSLELVRTPEGGMFFMDSNTGTPLLPPQTSA